MHHSCWLAPALLLVASVALLQCGSDEQSLGSHRTDTITMNAGGAGGEAGAPNSAGTGGQIAAARRICDGSTQLTFAYTIRGTSPLEFGSVVQHELGVGSFYVDGQCRYWVINSQSTSEGTWGPVHTGTLTAAQEAQLAADFVYEQWSVLKGDYSASVTQNSPTVTLFDRSSAISCVAGKCRADAPSAVHGIFQHAASWQTQLHAQGTPATTPMRLRAVYALSAKPEEIYPWTLGLALEPIIFDPSANMGQEPYGDSPLITDPGDLQALRQLRASALAAHGGAIESVYVEHSSPPFIQLFFRDTIPLEDEHGLIPIPAP